MPIMDLAKKITNSFCIIFLEPLDNQAVRKPKLAKWRDCMEREILGWPYCSISQTIKLSQVRTQTS